MIIHRFAQAAGWRANLVVYDLPRECVAPLLVVRGIYSYNWDENATAAFGAFT